MVLSKPEEDETLKPIGTRRPNHPKVGLNHRASDIRQQVRRREDILINQMLNDDEQAPGTGVQHSQYIQRPSSFSRPQSHSHQTQFDV